MPARKPGSAETATARVLHASVFEELEMLARMIGRPFGQLARRVIEKL